MALSDKRMGTELAPLERGGGLDVREGRWVRILVPVMILAVLVTASIWLWKLQEAKDRREAQLALKTSGRTVAQRAVRLIEAEIDRGGRLAREIARGRIQDAEQFAAAAEELGKSAPACLAIGWVPAHSPCAYAWSRGQEVEIRPGTNLRQGSSWGYAIVRSESDRDPRILPVANRGGKREFRAAIPVISGEGTSAALLGSLVLRLDAQRTLADLLDEPDARHYDVDLSDGMLMVIALGEPIRDEDPRVNTESMKVLNRFFWVRTRPTGLLLAQHSGQSALWVLWAGLPSSLLLAGIVWRVLHRRALAAEEARRQVRALEELTRTAGLISAGSHEGYEILNRLAASARRIVGTSAALIGLIDLRERVVSFIAEDGASPVGKPRELPLTQAMGTTLSISNSEVLVVEDVEHDSRVNSASLVRDGMRAVIFVPLIVEGRTLGMLYLSDDHPRRFTRAEIRLAALLGSQAAVILANYRLTQEKEAALAMQKKLLAQREAMHEVSSEIYRFDTLDESLQRLADAAPAAMGVDLCAVSLAVGKGPQMRVHAVTGNYANVRGETFDSRGTLVEDAWRDNRVVIVENADECANIHPAYRHRLKVGSAMYLPLLGSKHQPIGLMVMIRHAPGAFSKEQTDMAAVLAARASGAIELVRLYEDARGYAQSQEILLRELNHRVKNNLASIVTLLAVGRPPMPDSARYWLDRVTARVATMARTHELFVGPGDSVGLGDLINKLLPSLGVIKPTGVEFQVDVPEAPLRLETDRAVSLAMVINELCWNALEHGLGPGGVLQIRAHPGEPGRVIIEIEDEGIEGERPVQPIMSESERARPRGTGLRLVEGLVGRELNGTFHLRHKPGGGTVAQVDIPLVNGQASGID